jgi:hypothetical protein
MSAGTILVTGLFSIGTLGIGVLDSTSRRILLMELEAVGFGIVLCIYNIMEKKIEQFISPELRTILLQYPTVRVFPPRTTAQQKKIEERLKELDRLVAAVRK